MRSIFELLNELMDPESTELALATGRMPSVKQEGSFVPIERNAITDQDLLTALTALGGAEQIAKIGEKPLSWKTPVVGLGTVSTVVVRRGAILQARFVLRKDDSDDPPSAPPSPPSSIPDLEPEALRVAQTTQPGGQIARIAPIPVAAPARAAAVEVKATARDSSIPKAFVPEELAAVLATARREHATDVHVVADRPTAFRTSGALTPQGEALSAARAAAMLKPIVPARLAETLERTGSCDFALADPKVGRFRVNVSKQRTGIKGCFRLISREPPQLGALGLPPSLAEAMHHHHGLVLITGPTGSGKSTTLAALVDLLNRETGHHIVTIEDPIEHVHVPMKALLSQREVGTHTKTFESALKGALRQDPDVIVVGELRDTETVRMALTASETGHLVLATMNTPSAAKTIDRLIDLFPPGDQGQVRMSLAGGLRMIVGQRLVPAAQGGLVAAAETLPGCVPLSALIRDGKTFQIPSLQQRGKQLGIVRLDEQLMELVRTGRVTKEAARFFAESADFGGSA